MAALSPYFVQVRGTDVDEDMRHLAASRCAGLPNVTITADQPGDLSAEVDLVTMVAVLHHLDVADALRDVRRLLAPGGRFLAVPRSRADLAWEIASIITSPLIGHVKHPWPVNRDGVLPSPYPVREPTLTFDATRDLVGEVMPGARVRHQLGFRHTVAWTKDAETT